MLKIDNILFELVKENPENKGKRTESKFRKERKKK